MTAILMELLRNVFKTNLENERQIIIIISYLSMTPYEGKLRCILRYMEHSIILFVTI